MQACIPSHGPKRSWHSCPRRVNAGTQQRGRTQEEKKKSFYSTQTNRKHEINTPNKQRHQLKTATNKPQPTNQPPHQKNDNNNDNKTEPATPPPPPRPLRPQEKKRTRKQKHCKKTGERFNFHSAQMVKTDQNLYTSVQDKHVNNFTTSKQRGNVCTPLGLS